MHAMKASRRPNTWVDADKVDSRHGMLIILFFVLAQMVGWITHIIVSIQTGSVVFGVIGAVLVPVGAVNGWGNLLHFWS